MLLQALHVEIEMKNLNLQVTLLVHKGVGTPFPPHCTPAGRSGAYQLSCSACNKSNALHF